ncbi:MAG: molecular chaperone HtpG, partial [Burkholderiales bacterium]|nr:molecular chaperone HtpG [Burkholderiales bacterium]
MSNKKTLSFQTEVKQLLNLMIHSLYSNKEIFLRELVSNASDAIDKLRFLQIKQPELNDGRELAVTINFDKEDKLITISDNGIGMTYDEVIENIGTIAKSGTKSFLEQLASDDKKDANLIGQFGVGFYSAFIVADKVTLVTRKAGAPENEAVKWVSDGTGEYSIENVTKDHPGTEITLHLKDGQDDLLSDWQLRSLIRKYSDHINYPIKMLKMPEQDKDGKEIISAELETINKANALWTRNKSEITDEEYKEFYKHVSHDFHEPLKWIHSRVEGTQEYTQLLYIPSKAPYDLYDHNKRYGIKLYIKRVFIMDDAEKLLPNYLRFVRGIIDSQNLPLNISREILQSSKDIDAIRSGS